MYLERGFKKQAGAGLPIAIFIITVLSLIVFGMSQLQESSGNAVSLQIQSQRAFFAAESGAQLVLARILPNTDDTGEVWAKVSTEGVDGSAIEFGSGGLGGCKAVITATRIPNRIDPTLTALVKVRSIGSCGAGADGANREIEVTVQ